MSDDAPSATDGTDASCFRGPARIWILPLILVLVAACGGDEQSATAASGPDLPTTLPPPAVSIWITPHGEFEVFKYDDRQLSEEEKAKNPVINPRWEPFAQCMSDRGRSVVSDVAVGMRQHDIDALVDRLNREYPDRETNKQISTAADTSGLAADFLFCADEWLNLTPDELEQKLGHPVVAP